MLMGAKVLNYTKGFHNYYPLLSIPACLIGIYAVHKESWEYYCIHSILNILPVIHFTKMAKNELPTWGIKSAFKFFFGFCATSSYLVYALFRKELYIERIEKIRLQMNDKTYERTNKFNI